MPKITYKKTISVWSILILLTLLVLVGNYYGSVKTNAKYVQSVSGTDGARVACFVSDVKNLTASENVILSPAINGYVECYSFSVTNQKDSKVSEVAIEYDLNVEVSGPVGVEYRISSTGGSANINACAQSNVMDENILKTSGGSFRAGVRETHTYVIEATWGGIGNVSYENANVPITVRVSADVVQKD